MSDLALDEQETHFSIVANDRSKVHVTTDDPVWIARLNKIATALPESKTDGKEYILRIDQLVVRKGKKQISEAQRVKLSERLAILRDSQ